MHCVPKVKSGSTEDKFIAKISDGTEFLITVHESNCVINIYVGGNQTYCIQAHINRKKSKNPDEPCSTLLSPDVAYIHNVYTDELCALNRTLSRGSDTRNIFMIMLSIIKKFAPYVKEVHFNDESTRKCDSGVHANLALMHYLQDGKTWYQSHFNAVMDEDDVTALHKAETHLNTLGISWNDLNRHYITTELPLPQHEMKELFDHSSTLLNFFRRLYDTIKIAKFCDFIGPWIELFMQKPRFPFSFRAAQFRIYTQNINSMNFEWLSISEKRGGKQTRRARRRRGAYF
jgi:hypothetical protein